MPKFISLLLSFSLIFQPVAAYAQYIPGLNLPTPGTMVNPSPSFVPVLIKGLSIHPENPFQFDFIVNSGNSRLTTNELRKESERMVRYFLASLTVPDGDLWVNLSPHEQNRIIPDELGKTELGRDMLAQDYLLKQLTASMIDPQKDLGKKFWERVHKLAQEKYGTVDIPMETFNRVWILPETATVFEKGTAAYVVESRLKVLMEEDYLAIQASQSHKVTESQEKSCDLVTCDPVTSEINSLGSKIVRDLILPEIEKEINTGRNFAPLRQIYHSLILAKWYKETIKETLFAKVYVDKNKIAGVDLSDPTIKDKIYAQYVAAYKKGVFNYIKEDYDAVSQESIPRKYFSGGEKWQFVLNRSSNPAMLTRAEKLGNDFQMTVEAEVRPAKAQSPIVAERRQLPSTSSRAMMGDNVHVVGYEANGNFTPIPGAKIIFFLDDSKGELNHYKDAVAPLLATEDTVYQVVLLHVEYWTDMDQAIESLKKADALGQLKLVVTDYEMGSADGRFIVDLVKRINRESGLDIKTLLVSGAERTNDFGADVFMLKSRQPENVTTLSRVIKTLVNPDNRSVIDQRIYQLNSRQLVRALHAYLSEDHLEMLSSARQQHAWELETNRNLFRLFEVKDLDALVPLLSSRDTKAVVYQRSRELSGANPLEILPKELTRRRWKDWSGNLRVFRTQFKTNIQRLTGFGASKIDAFNLTREIVYLLEDLGFDVTSVKRARAERYYWEIEREYNSKSAFPVPLRPSGVKIHDYKAVLKLRKGIIWLLENSPDLDAFNRNLALVRERGSFPDGNGAVSAPAEEKPKNKAMLAEPDVRKTIRFVPIGDSYTIGTGTSPENSWPAILTRRLQAHGINLQLIANPAKNGKTTQYALDKELEVFQQAHPDFGTLLIGVNDYVQGVSPEIFRENIAKLMDGMIQALPGPDRLIVMTIPDYTVIPEALAWHTSVVTKPITEGGRGVTATLEEFNAIIRDEASKRNLRIVDSSPLSDAMRTNDSLIAPDRTHPSAQGYAVWEKLVFKQIKMMPEVFPGIESVDASSDFKPEEARAKLNLFASFVDFLRALPIEDVKKGDWLTVVMDPTEAEKEKGIKEGNRKLVRFGRLELLDENKKVFPIENVKTITDVDRIDRTYVISFTTKDSDEVKKFNIKDGNFYLTDGTSFKAFHVLKIYQGVDEVRFVPIGDSYTIGTGAAADQSWPAVLTERLQRQGVNIHLVANPSVNGWTTDDVIRDELPIFKDSNPDFSTLLIGVNDYVQGMTPDQFRANVTTILDEMLKILPGKDHLVVITIPDYTVTLGGRNFHDKVVMVAKDKGGRGQTVGLEEFNKILKEEAQKRSVRVVDSSKLSTEMTANTELIAEDGLHPSALGYAVWEGLVYPQVHDALKSLSLTGQASRAMMGGLPITLTHLGGIEQGAAGLGTKFLIEEITLRGKIDELQSRYPEVAARLRAVIEDFHSLSASGYSMASFDLDGEHPQVTFNEQALEQYLLYQFVSDFLRRPKRWQILLGNTQATRFEQKFRVQTWAVLKTEELTSGILDYAWLRQFFQPLIKGGNIQAGEVDAIINKIMAKKDWAGVVNILEAKNITHQGLRSFLAMQSGGQKSFTGQGTQLPPNNFYELDTTLQYIPKDIIMDKLVKRLVPAVFLLFGLDQGSSSRAMMLDPAPEETAEAAPVFTLPLRVKGKKGQPDKFLTREELYRLGVEQRQRDARVEKYEDAVEEAVSWESRIFVNAAQRNITPKALEKKRQELFNKRSNFTDGKVLMDGTPVRNNDPVLQRGTKFRILTGKELWTALLQRIAGLEKLAQQAAEEHDNGSVLYYYVNMLDMAAFVEELATEAAHAEERLGEQDPKLLRILRFVGESEKTSKATVSVRRDQLKRIILSDDGGLATHMAGVVTGDVTRYDVDGDVIYTAEGRKFTFAGFEGANDRRAQHLEKITFGLTGLDKAQVEIVLGDTASEISITQSRGDVVMRQTLLNLLSGVLKSNASRAMMGEIPVRAAATKTVKISFLRQLNMNHYVVDQEGRIGRVYYKVPKEVKIRFLRLNPGPGEDIFDARTFEQSDLEKAGLVMATTAQAAEYKRQRESLETDQPIGKLRQKKEEARALLQEIERLNNAETVNKIVSDWELGQITPPNISGDVGIQALTRFIAQATNILERIKRRQAKEISFFTSTVLERQMLSGVLSGAVQVQSPIQSWLEYFQSEAGKAALRSVLTEQKALTEHAKTAAWESVLQGNAVLFNNAFNSLLKRAVDAAYPNLELIIQDILTNADTYDQRFADSVERKKSSPSSRAMMAVKEVFSKIVKTVGGKDTLRVDVTLTDGSSGHFVQPAGTSSGEDEAKTVGVAQAAKNIQEIHAAVLAQSVQPDELPKIGKVMLAMGKDRLGAEATLSYQMSTAWAVANSRKIGLYQLIRELAPDLAPPSKQTLRTRIQYNITNGGAHAQNDLDMQEFMVVTSGRTIAEANAMSDKIDRELGSIYRTLWLQADPDDKGTVGPSRGLEGGYSIPNLTLEKLREIYANIDQYQMMPELRNLNLASLRDRNVGLHEFVINALIAAIRNSGYTPSKSGEVGTVALALDIAASEMYEDGMYSFEGRRLTSQELTQVYQSWVKQYPIDSIEDAKDQNDWDGWIDVIKTLGDDVMLIGDDLLVTQADRLTKFIELLRTNGLLDAAGKVTKRLGILIKLNQNGFLTTGIDDPKEGYLGTLEVIRLAKKHGIEAIISHRSQEALPEDNEVSIADLAAAINAYLKSGDHVQPTRAVKENRLADIDAEIRSSRAMMGNQVQGRLHEITGMHFHPMLDFKHGAPLTEADIQAIRRRAQRDNAEVRELLQYAKKEEIELSITGHLRGVDGPGSSLDLPEFQRLLTELGVRGIDQLPSTPTIASEFTTKITIEYLDDPDKIVYVAPDYGFPESKPYVVSGKVKLKNGVAPKKQLDAVGYIFNNIFGVTGVKITLAGIPPMALAGGMESSNVFNVALIAAVSSFCGVNLSEAEIFNLAVKLENDEFDGLTGGQGHLATLTGGAHQHIWLSGVHNEPGVYVNPYSAVSVPFLEGDALTSIEEHMMLVQAGKEYKNGKPAVTRLASFSNRMWTDLLRDRDAVGLPLHQEKIGLAQQYIEALKKKDFETAAKVTMRYVEIRDLLIQRWLGLVADALEGKNVPAYAREYKRRVFDTPKDHPDYDLYELTRNIYQSRGVEGLRAANFYTWGPIRELVNAAKANGIAIMPLGAGGPGSNLIAIDPRGTDHLRQFLEQQGLSDLEKAGDAAIRNIIQGTGTLKGYMPFRVGKEPMQFHGFEQIGLQVPELPELRQITERTTGQEKVSTVVAKDIAQMIMKMKRYLTDTITQLQSVDLSKGGVIFDIDRTLLYKESDLRKIAKRKGISYSYEELESYQIIAAVEVLAQKLEQARSVGIASGNDFTKITERLVLRLQEHLRAAGKLQLMEKLTIYANGVGSKVKFKVEGNEVKIVNQQDYYKKFEFSSQNITDMEGFMQNLIGNGELLTIYQQLVEREVGKPVSREAVIQALEKAYIHEGVLMENMEEAFDSRWLRGAPDWRIQRQVATQLTKQRSNPWLELRGVEHEVVQITIKQLLSKLDVEVDGVVVKIDLKKSLREEIIAKIKAANILPAKFTLYAGGETSIDIGAGDKNEAVEDFIVSDGLEREHVIYFGDEFKPKGNDAIVLTVQGINVVNVGGEKDVIHDGILAKRFLLAGENPDYTWAVLRGLSPSNAAMMNGSSLEKLTQSPQMYIEIVAAAAVLVHDRLKKEMGGQAKTFLAQSRQSADPLAKLLASGALFGPSQFDPEDVLAAWTADDVLLNYIALAAIMINPIAFPGFENLVTVRVEEAMRAKNQDPYLKMIASIAIALNPNPRAYIPGDGLGREARIFIQKALKGKGEGNKGKRPDGKGKREAQGQPNEILQVLAAASIVSEKGHWPNATRSDAEVVLRGALENLAMMADEDKDGRLKQELADLLDKRDRLANKERFGTPEDYPAAREALIRAQEAIRDFMQRTATRIRATDVQHLRGKKGPASQAMMVELVKPDVTGLWSPHPAVRLATQQAFVLYGDALLEIVRENPHMANLIHIAPKDRPYRRGHLTVASTGIALTSEHFMQSWELEGGPHLSFVPEELGVDEFIKIVVMPDGTRRALDYLRDSATSQRKTMTTFIGKFGEGPQQHEAWAREPFATSAAKIVAVANDTQNTNVRLIHSTPQNGADGARMMFELVLGRKNVLLEIVEPPPLSDSATTEEIQLLLDLAAGLGPEEEIRKGELQGFATQVFAYMIHERRFSSSGVLALDPHVSIASIWKSRHAIVNGMGSVFAGVLLEEHEREHGPVRQFNLRTPEDILDLQPEGLDLEQLAKIVRGYPPEGGKFVDAMSRFLVKNRAMMAGSKELAPGGIGMDKIDVKKQGPGVLVKFDEQQIQNLMSGNFGGFAPVTINFVPIPSFLPLLGLEPKKEEELQVSSAK